MGNRSLPLLFHDNARPHAARETVFTLQDLQLEIIRYPSHLPELAPTDNFFFSDLIYILYWYNISSQEAVRNAFILFVESRFSEIYRKGLKAILTRWQKCIDNEDKYFD